MPRLRELGRNGKTNYETTYLHRVKKKRESNWQRRDRVEEGKEFGKTMEHSTAKTEMVKTVEKKGVANTKAAALGGGRGSDWEERENKNSPWCHCRGSRGRRRCRGGTLPRERERGRAR